MNQPLHSNRREAFNAGATFFFTGKPCIRGHVAARYVSSGACCKCVNFATRGPRGYNVVAASGPFIFAELGQPREVYERAAALLMSPEWTAAALQRVKTP